MILKVKKLNKNSVLPSYAKKGDAGMDLTAVSLSKTIQYYEYGTGLAVEIPYGYVGLVFPRSSISKTDHFLRNSVGVIDSGYRGEIKLRMSLPALGEKQYKVGEKIGQLMIIKLPWVDIEEAEKLSETDRGDGGFGSTGI
jgi:dUTP pyrophosphatase